MVAEHPNELVRDQYIGAIAGRVDIPAEQLMRSVSAARARGDRQRRSSPRNPPPRASGPETEALKVAMHQPEAVAGKLHEVLFTDPAHRDAFLAIAGGASITDAIEDAPPDAADLLRRLAVEDTDADPDDVLAGLARLAADAATARLSEPIGGRCRPMRRSFDARSGWLKHTREQLNDDDSRRGRH